MVSDFVHWNGMNVNITERDSASSSNGSFLWWRTYNIPSLQSMSALIVTSPLPLCQVMWMALALPCSVLSAKLIITHVFLCISYSLLWKGLSPPRSQIKWFLSCLPLSPIISTYITIINTHLVILPIYRCGNRQCGTNQLLIYNRISTHLYIVIFTFMENVLHSLQLHICWLILRQFSFTFSSVQVFIIVFQFISYWILILERKPGLHLPMFLVFKKVCISLPHLVGLI